MYRDSRDSGNRGRGEGSDSRSNKNDFVNRFWIQGVVTQNKNNDDGFDYKEFSTGSRKITFSLMVKNGENTTFFRVSAWNDIADQTADFLKPHMLVRVKGFMTTRKNEKTGYSEIELSATSVENARQSKDDRGSDRGEDRGDDRGRGDDRPRDRQRGEIVRDGAERRGQYQERGGARPERRDDRREERGGEGIPSVNYENPPRQDTRMDKNEIKNSSDKYEIEDDSDIPF